MFSFGGADALLMDADRVRNSTGLPNEEQSDYSIGAGVVLR